jgi:photosystem II reaction center protein PsbP
LEIVRFRASKEKNAIHKTLQKNKLLILAALGFLLIGLTITNLPVVYSNSSSDIEDGVEEESSDEEEESSDGEEEESSDEEEEQSVEMEEICGNGEDDDDDGKIDDEDSDCKEQQGDKKEICGNGEDDDDDGKIDNEDSQCKEQQGNKKEICGNGEDDDDDGKIDNEDSDCKAEFKSTGTFIVQVKNDNGGSKQPQDFKLTIKVSEGKASPTSFSGADSPGTQVEFSGGGEFSVITKRPHHYTESLGSNCPSDQIHQTFTCTITYEDQEDLCSSGKIRCAIAEPVLDVESVTVIGSISTPDTGASTTLGPDTGASTTPGPDTGASTTPGPDTGASTTPGPETGQGIQKPPLTPQPFTSYKSDEKSVSVNYPHDWQITENANNVTFKSPSESSSDKFEEALRVLKVPYKNSLSALTDEIVGEAKANLPSFQIINSSDTVLGGIPANSLVYIYTDDRVGTLQEMVILTIKDDSAYIIGYTAESPKYTYYLPVVQKMINSIQIGDNKAETSLLPFLPKDAPTGGEIG